MKIIIRPSNAALRRVSIAIATSLLLICFGSGHIVRGQELPTATPSPDDQTLNAQPVIVSATRTDIPLTESPATASVVTSEDIEQKQIERVGDALREVPGLAVVLDPDAFFAALRQAAPEADLRSAQISYMRYKPHHFCRATCRLNLAGAEVDADVHASRPGDFVQEPGRIVLKDCAVVVNVFPNDLRLPALRFLTDARQRQQMLRELLPNWADLWQGELRCLRYRPERRYVAALLVADEPQAALKVSTAKAYRRGKRNAEAFKSRGPLRVARLLGGSVNHHLLAYEWMPGRLLMELCTAPEFDREAVTAAGAALASLHAQDSADLTYWTREAEAADLLSVSSEIGFFCPHLACRVDGLARRLAARLAGAPAMRFALHGDFSANQVLIGEQDVAIIDFDLACYGDPAEDLGNFLAQAERNVLRDRLSASRVEPLKTALLEGYAQATNRPLPERIGLYTAVEVFRRCRSPFRAREPDWAQRTEVLLDRAATLLNALP